MAQQRVIRYTRVSTSEQVDGFGLEVQEAAIGAYSGRSRSVSAVVAAEPTVMCDED
jgi:hypothetical protein